MGRLFADQIARRRMVLGATLRDPALLGDDIDGLDQHREAHRCIDVALLDMEAWADKCGQAESGVVSVASLDR